MDKLLSLARTFGVTTDELLSEDDPAHAQEDAPPERTGAAPAQRDDLERTVGVLRQLARRYRWWLGAGIALIGVLILTVSGIRWYTAQNDFNRYMASTGPNGNYIEYVDETGQTVVEPPLAVRSPDADHAAMAMLFGVMTLAAGAVWARRLYRKQSFG